MRKFDGKDLVTWILHMKKYFDLHEVKLLQKVRMATLYLEPNQFVWYQWLFSRKQFITTTLENLLAFQYFSDVFQTIY